MPKVVDHQQRRQEVVEALWKVVYRGGLEAASLRNVSAEAGLSVGATRHYFSNQQELLSCAMSALVDRVGLRIAAIDRSEPSSVVAESIVLEVLPLDDQRQVESEIWFDFVSRSRVDLQLRQVANESYDKLRRALDSVCQMLLPTPESDPGHQVRVEQLFALVDGLALHAVQRPGHLSPEQIRTVVRAQLRSLSASQMNDRSE